MLLLFSLTAVYRTTDKDAVAVAKDSSAGGQRTIFSPA
jgi:hypothetical protein